MTSWSSFQIYIKKYKGTESPYINIDAGEVKSATIELNKQYGIFIDITQFSSLQKQRGQ